MLMSFLWVSLYLSPAQELGRSINETRTPITGHDKEILAAPATQTPTAKTNKIAAAAAAAAATTAIIDADC
uniref:Putative secreted protein n=1 Tax=Anopheles darlingi TaxID=43151 RepID=A0A2M4DKM0_ANODA